MTGELDTFVVDQKYIEDMIKDVADMKDRLALKGLYQYQLASLLNRLERVKAAFS